MSMKPYSICPLCLSYFTHNSVFKDHSVGQNFLFIAEMHPIVEINHTGGLLSGFHLLVIENSDALNTCVPAFV